MRDNQRPVQTPRRVHGQQGAITTEMHLRAYEVYCEYFSPQPALIDMEGRGCRGGFGMGELIAFLYARSFPKVEWKQRVDEAFAGIENV